MKRITSFRVDHTKLKKGIYISRIDGDCITYDIRMTEPNNEPALKPEAAHAIEHIGATLLRNGAYQDHIIYFGPMGCMTGFYLIVRDLNEETVREMVMETYRQIASWDQEIPGASIRECGNYTYMDLEAAKASASHFVDAKLEYQYHFLDDPA
ncbi:MAG: S-ribosylhomocysteine lyase [bacterium]